MFSSSLHGTEQMVSRISVRSLVEFIFRHGDIDNRRNAPSDEAMQAGSRIHRLIQSMQGTEYAPEVSLKYEYDTALCHVILEGRADGIITLTKSVTIDEIKTTYRDVSGITGAEPVHLAQAKCYAAVYLLQNGLEKISVRMTYVNQETEDIRYFHSHYGAEEITAWFEELCSEYAKWLDMQAEWRQLRQESIGRLRFPYEFRPGQKELAVHVYNTIYHGRKLFIEAPTGTGKTLSVLFPAIKSMGEERGDRIFYLTARTIARTVAEGAADVLKDNGLKLKNITITAREKICFTEEHKCDPVSCPYAKGHFDRINECLYEMVSTETAFTREVCEKYASRYEVCPYELTLDACIFADMIICDYNYVFDPEAYLRRFFGESVSGQTDCLFLVDEAHNLVDRGREMYSASLIKEDLLACRRACKTSQPKITALIDKCNAEMLALKRSCIPGAYPENEETYSVQQAAWKYMAEDAPESQQVLAKFQTPLAPCVVTGIDSLIVRVERLHSAITEYLSDNSSGEGHEEIVELYFTLSSFLNIYDLLDEKYLIYTDFNSDGNFFVKLFCVDPSRNLAECMKRARSTVLFSATLLPIQYYKSLLGGTKEDYEVYARSVFGQEQRLLIRAVDAGSRYALRGRKQYELIARYIHEITSARSGNYMIFAPSYDFMYEVYNAYDELYHDELTEEIICQNSQMREAEKEEFLDRFRRFAAETSESAAGSCGYDLESLIRFDIDTDDTETSETAGDETGAIGSLLGFCVLGGIFSEGIDLKDDALIGVIIIGTGLPQIGGERELLKKYYDHNGQNGFDYAYRFPGMNRVQQAAGRLIRTESDRGIIALIDDRYGQNSNRRLFPREWSDCEPVNIGNVGSRVRNFWNSCH